MNPSHCCANNEKKQNSSLSRPNALGALAFDLQQSRCGDTACVVAGKTWPLGLAGEIVSVLHKVSTVDVVILLFATLGALVVVFHLTAAVLALGIVRQIVDRLDWRRSGMIDRGSGGKWLVHDGFTVCEA